MTQHHNASSFMKTRYQKLALTLLLVLFSVLSITKIFDSYGFTYTDESFERSLYAFGIAKTLNGAISIMQGTEVALEPAGIGVILTPGQILDPINDLVERFSWVMLLSATSLGIQKVLIGMFSSTIFSSTVAVALCIVAFSLWRSSYFSAKLKNILYRIVMFIFILRFVIPSMAIANDGLYTAFLQPTYEESTLNLAASDKAISKISTDSAEKKNQDITWYGFLGNSIESAINSINVDQRVADIKAEAENITKHIVDLIVIFTIQTILFPLFFLWLAVKLIKSSLTVNFQ